MSRTARTGVFGGSFNPLHLGHLLVAEDVRRRCRLDRVLFLAGPRPPHKPARALAPWPRRQAMLRLGLTDWPQLELTTIEERLAGPAYTVDALAALRRDRPGESLYLLLGADQYRTMAGWHEPTRLTELTRLVVMSRPGSPRPRLFPGHPARRVRFIPVIEVDLAGSDIRARLARGQSIRYMLPTSVQRYLRRHGLYGSTVEPAGRRPRPGRN
ncbi:MAG: nicotinate-nucleotide adenylyltransferase [bacterium]